MLITTLVILTSPRQTSLTLLWLAESEVAPMTPSSGIHTLCNLLQLSRWGPDLFFPNRMQLHQ